MCGIFAIFNENGVDTTIRAIAYEQSRIQRHRGPDECGVLVFDKGVMVQERLSLIGIETGHQPLVSENGDIILIANCEIYNYKTFIPAIEKHIEKKYIPRTDADVLIALYDIFGENMFTSIDGMFAFVLFDKKKDKLFIARDPIGIIPMYMGYDNEGKLWIASEMKCLMTCQKIEVFEPGCYLHGQISSLKKVKYFDPIWAYRVPEKSVDLDELKSILIKEVEMHLEADADIGSLLSGGLDSSLIAGIASKIMNDSHSSHYGKKLHTYSIGIQGSPDLKYAKEVADFIDSIHHEIVFTVREGIDCIKEIIWFLETYDVTTVRASIPMFILSRNIKKHGIKVVLSGEGADEIFGGYLYFHFAPNEQEFHKESVRRVLDLSYFDCLRANKSTMAWGVEARVPFLGKLFIDYCMEIKPKDKMSLSSFDSERTEMEKYILRKAFSKSGIIPESVIWRQKEQFSDGVGYDWVDNLKKYCEFQITDEEFNNRLNRFKFNTPNTKEAYYYRSIFDTMFGKIGETTVKCWVPRTDWGCSSDPSGRRQKNHKSSIIE